jgi:hypothetical protein
MSNRQRKFGMEKLEARQMMAGDVTAFVNAAGDLYVNEAPSQVGQDNAIKMTTRPDGKIRVETNPDTGNSLVNGGNFQDFVVTGNVYVTLGGGRDTVYVGSPFSPNPAFDLTAPGAQSFNRFVHINVGSNSASGASDDDMVSVWGADVEGLVQIDTGAGTDWVGVASSTIFGDGLQIGTGAGQDRVLVTLCDLDALAVQTYSSLTEADFDYLSIVSTDIVDSLRARLGGGNDQFRLELVDVGNDIDIDAGAGNDTGLFERVTAVDEVMLQMGNGSDRLNLQRVTARHLNALGGNDSGIDTLTTRSGLANTNSFRTSTISGWEWIDGLRNLNIVVNDVMPVRRFTL